MGRKENIHKGSQRIKLNKIRENLSQNRAATMANAKGIKHSNAEENKQNFIINPGPGQYDMAFSDELKILDHKLSARYKKVPFGTSSERFKLKEYEENIKNKKNSKLNEDMNNPNALNGKFFVNN